MNHKQIIQKELKYIEKILAYTENRKYEDFVGDSMLVEACVFNLGQIGELANKVDSDFAKSHPSIPWRVLYGLRNRIIHDYDGVNLVLIWDIISEDLPELKIQLEALYKEI